VAALEIASAAGVTTLLNPAPSTATPDALAGLADIVVPNEVEAQQLTGHSCDGDGAIAVARQLARDVARRASVVTLGERGAVVAARTATGSIEVTWIEPHPIVAVDTVGAGDAFCGALSAELATGRDLVDAVRTANAAGALAATAPGAVAAIPTALRVRRMLDAVAPPAGVSETLDV
jgi:ribokinase